jgi:hypothetical protein
MTSIDSWASRRGSQVAVSTIALRENVCSARDQRQHNCLPGKVQNLFARRLVSWPHGAQDSEAIFTAKIVWSCGGRAIEHGVGLERKGRLEAGYGVDRGTSWSIRLGDEVEPFGLEFMAAKRNLWWSDQQGSSDMKGTRVSISNGRWSSGGERWWKRVVGLSQSERQGVTCGDDGRVFAVAFDSGAKEDGACR